MYSPANITSPLKNDAKKLKVAAPTIAARKKSFRSAPQIVRGLLIDLGTRLKLGSFVMAISYGKSHAMKLTALMAMPTPKMIPARVRFDCPSPNANMRPPTTIEMSASPRAMTPVNEFCRTWTALSQRAALRVHGYRC
jgi:hypothetical protein